MSDTFDHEQQAYDSWEAEEGPLFFGTDVPSIMPLGPRCSSSSSSSSATTREGIRFDGERYGGHLIAGMTAEHCRNAMKYLVRTNGANLGKYRDTLKSLNNRIVEAGESKGYALINMDTGEIEELAAS